MPLQKCLIFSILSLLLTNSCLGFDGGPQRQIDFSRDIRPILSDNCFQCHGPDEASREAGLRLDVASEANESAFVPGSLDDSEAWQRIISDDPDSLMPPPDSHKQLDDDQKNLIKGWIEAGARYQKHWAFRTISKPKVPKVDDPRFSESPLDGFVYRAMKSRGLGPAPIAERHHLIRRVTQDLTGLPPTREEVEQFLADSSPEAYQKLVDRLLASPHFGERMAVDWMDVARYGDTSVFHADGPRSMWRWRDWVVAAFNDNLPYDDFTIKQLAGDLLPNASIDDQVASGFNRNNASTDEGGAIAEEFRVEYAVDRVKTTSMVWMGLSMECAQCHDHKYDPISQKDYYRFFAFFNQAADPGMQTRRGNQAPIVNIPNQELLAQVPEVVGQLKATEKKLAELRKNEQPKLKDWLATRVATDSQSPPADTSSLFQFEQKDKLVNESDANDKTQLHGKPGFEAGKTGKALRTRGGNYASSKSTASQFDGSQSISYGCWVKFNRRAVGAPIARMDESNGHVGFDLFLQNDGVAAHFIHRWPGDAVKVIAPAKLANKKWHHLFVTYDGSKSATGIRIYVNGEFVESKPSHNSLKGSTKTKTPFTIGRRKQSSQFDGWIDDVRVYDRELSAAEVALIAKADPLPELLAIAEDERTQEQKDQIFEIYLNRQVPEYGQLKKQIAETKAKIERLKKPLTSVMVMKDIEKPRMTYVLDRGQYDAPNKEQPVSPGVPDFLPEFDGKYAANRLGMAQWLTSPDHPLTARVTVNRIWKLFMGNGLVESVEDFGLQGTWPSHPDLLDWLAADFIEHEWNLKRLVRMIVMSQAYQQASTYSEQQLSIDPQNQFLSSGPRFRLGGEFLRDQVLAVSGLLNPQMGGPGVKPYQPPGLWNEVSLDGGLRFKRDAGDKLYRRSLYTYWKRSSPPPNMVIFDAPTREKCTVRRGKTNTPLQALVLMNDPQFVEAARIFAERILKHESKDVEQKLEFAFMEALSRKPGSDELELLSRLLERELAQFKKHPEKAKQLLQVGEKKADPQLDPPSLAAWTIITNLIFNLDEFVTRG